MFCFLVQFQDYCCLHFNSLDEYSKELLPGPWSVKFLPFSTHDIISVHNSIIVFTQDSIHQFQLTQENSLSIECEKITAIMQYSDKCNRILCACGHKLIWLHVSPDNIKATMAANLPISSKIDKLINLAAGNSVIVFCYSSFNESMVIMINLKTLTAGEIVKNI